MDFTFGIITGGNNDEILNQIIDSIELEKIPNYEILIIGGFKGKRKNTTVVDFDENIKPLWITRKKNLITSISKYENIVYLHDYIKLNPGWYEGQLISGNDFHIRMDKIINYDGKRYRDWCIWPHNENNMDSIIGRDCLIPYDITHLSKYMYISGAYWICKKYVMEKYPLYEHLSWGQGEDVIWSKQVREIYDFNMNVNSCVQILKHSKDRVFSEPSEEKIKILNDRSKWI